MKKIVVHFGGGALGRGLVVPLLVQSDCEVVLVDVEEQLLQEIKQKHGYPLFVTDESSDQQQQFIQIKDAISSVQESDKLAAYLKKATVITTAVRRENLIHVVNTLLHSLDGQQKKLVICAENIENVSYYFQQLLQQTAQTERHRRIAESLIVPNTIVDRICSSEWPKSLQINTEVFHELAVDQGCIAKTDLALIPTIQEIDAAFARKRLLVNTYADASSFLALAEGKHYLHEAITDETIQQKLAPYFEGFIVLLKEKYHYTAEELSDWQRIYTKRLANPKIARELDSVARNLWPKLTLQERFVWPLLELIELGVDVTTGTRVLIDLIQCSSKENNSVIQKKLKELWSQDAKGDILYQIAEHYLTNGTSEEN